MPQPDSGDASMFAAIDAAFIALSQGADPLGLNCAPHADTGLPARFMTLLELRDWLLSHPGPGGYAAHNAVWRDLVGYARTDPAWMTAALGMALPALARAAGQLNRGHRGGRDDIDAEMVTAFMTAIHDLDPSRSGLYETLRWQAIRAGMAVRDQQQTQQPVADIEQVAAVAPRLPYGHPDLILARAVTAAIIDAADAELILHTRLNHTPLEVAAARQGLDVATARMRRMRAERVLVAALHDGLLSAAVSAQSRRRSGQRATMRAAVRAARTAG